jgi:hypothetical protein
MTRTTDRDTAEGLIRRRVAQATTGFEIAKAKFTEAFETNPKYAIEWHAKGLASAQHCYEFWTAVADVLAKRGIAEALKHANTRARNEVEGFFGSNSTCLWTNALRRTEAEVLNFIARHDLSNLDKTA